MTCGTQRENFPERLHVRSPTCCSWWIEGIALPGSTNGHQKPFFCHRVKWRPCYLSALRKLWWEKISHLLKSVVQKLGEKGCVRREVKTAYRQFLGGFLGCPLTVIQVWTQIKPAQISAVPDLVTVHSFAFLVQLKVDLTWLMVWCLEISKVDLAMQTKSLTVLGSLRENLFWMKKTGLFCPVLSCRLSCLCVQLPQEGATSLG